MTSWLIETLVASALLMGLVLALRAPVRRLFGARAAYALWLLPVLRMVLPPLPGWRAWFVPVVVLRPQERLVGLVDADTAIQLATAPMPAGPIAPGPLLDPVPDASWHLGTLAIALWLAGAAITFAIALLRYRRFLSEALAHAVPLATECGVEVLASPTVPGPVATGVFRRRILLPADFLHRFTPEERRLALLHEGAHHDRLDIAANFVALAAQALHWWNPLAWIAHRAFRADQELACDETVLADGRNSRTAYARALMKSAVARTPAMACSLNPTRHLKQRIRTMAHAPYGRTRLIAGGLVALAAIVAGTVATASGLPPVPPVPSAPPVPAVAPVARVAMPAPPAPPAPLARAIPVPPAPPMPPRFSGHHATAADIRAARRDAIEAQREGAEARREALREADHYRREALREAAGARREADLARLEGLRAAQEARMEAMRSARMERPSPVAIHRMVEASMAQSRARMAAACAAKGSPVAATADYRTLALCGQDMRLALASARRAIEGSTALGAQERARALAGIDQAIARSR